MMDNLSELPLKKYNSSNYRQQSNQSTVNTIIELPNEQNLKMNNKNTNQLMIPKFNKQNINSQMSSKSSKNINNNIDEMNKKKINYTNINNLFLGQNLTNSCYFTKQRQYYNNNRKDIQKYQIKQYDQIDIIINQPNNQQINLPTLKHKYSNNSNKSCKRYSHLVQSTPSYYQYSNYQQYQPNNSNTYNYKDQNYRLRQTTQPKNEYNSFEIGDIKPCLTSRTNRSNYQKVRNSYVIGSTSNSQSNKKYINTTFPYTSSVTYSNHRQPLMSESMGLAKVNEKFRCFSNNNDNDNSLKLSVSVNKVDNEFFPRTRSRSSMLREPQLDDFNIGQCKGEGRFGKVYIAIHKKTGFLCALKKVKKESVKYMMDQFIQEIKIQLFLNHPKLVKLYGYFSDQEHFYMLIQYMEDGSLYSLMKKNKKIQQSQTIQKLRQICQGIKQMHDNNIVHRDLKPQNVVITHGVCKVCDFGWAAICQDRRQTYCGTLDYVCPEIIQGNSYDSGVDVWCIGVLAYQLMCGKAPFYDISRKKTMEKIKSCKIENFPSHLSGEAIRFIQMILIKDPDNRIGIQELLDSAFLKSHQK